MKFDVNIWDTGIENPPNPYYEFVRQYAAGRTKMKWRKMRVDVSIQQKMWLDACSNALKALTRRELCTLYVYTTQAYATITDGLRNNGKFDVRSFQQKQADEWLYGLAVCITYIKNQRQDIMLKLFVGATPVDILNAFKDSVNAYLLDKTETTNKDIHDRFAKLRPYFASKFSKKCHELALEFHEGLIFYNQIVSVMKPPSHSITFIKTILPKLNASDWQTILHQFVVDLDALFTKLPPVPTTFNVFRGTRSRISQNQLLHDAAFSSTTLSRKVAQGFMDETRKCCVHTIRVPKGTHVLPVMLISRYYGELELLLPRKVTRV